MKKRSRWAPGLGVRILGAEQIDGQWMILAVGDGDGVCPDCGSQSMHRHGWHQRHLQDLPAQGAGVNVKLRIQRWQCRNNACERQTFTGRLPQISAPLARRTTRATELVHLFGPGVGGRPGERLLTHIGMPISDDTILRCLKRRARARRADASVRVLGVDDWAWRKGSTYGTIVVDLERRQVIDLLPDRSAGATADWLRRHPDIEVISRDRCGSFAQGARDKHGGAEHRCLTRMANRRSRQATFERVGALHGEGRSVSDIVRQTGFDRRTIAKWIRADALPQRNAAAPKTTSPACFEEYLSRRWSEGCLRGRRLFPEIKARGYTGSFSNLERLLAKWRNPKHKVARPAPPAPRAPAVDPATGRSISPIVAAALCVKPRGTLTSAQAAKVDALKSEWPDFAAMRRLTMRFRGLLRSGNASKLGVWLKDAQESGLYAMQRFARTVRRDIDAVRNAIVEPWSNGQTEGQINRLKTLKRAM